ncbi:uncharacterized protein [Watersipora subatra]|uniref:uncharacterized protein n=1 Tax=Watersipora subatra TaxID=2589382 RepID=UPI00355C0CDF
MAKCALTKCCCFDLHSGTLGCLIYVMISTLIAAALALVDLVDMNSSTFKISGSFPAEFRIHINDVMEHLDRAIVVCHLLIFLIAILTFVVSQNEDTKLNVCALLFFTIVMSLYILFEFAMNMYFFTWMNHNIFILPYICFLWIFWIVRTIVNILVVVVAHSRIIDLKFQKKYDLLNMPGVNHSLTAASELSCSMRSVAGQQAIRAMSSQRLYASRQSLQQSSRSLNRSNVSLNRGAVNF